MFEDERVMERDEIADWPDDSMPRASRRTAARRSRVETEIAEGAEATGPEHSSESRAGDTPPTPSPTFFSRPAKPPMPAPPQQPPPGDWTAVVESLTGVEPKPATPPAPAPVVPLNEELVRYARQVEKDLVAAASAPPDEALLAKLASGEISSAFELQNLQAQLVRRATILVDHVDQVRTLMRALRDLGMVLDGISRRVHGSLTASASLRAQRRFLRSANDE